MPSTTPKSTKASTSNQNAEDALLALEDDILPIDLADDSADEAEEAPALDDEDEDEGMGLTAVVGTRRHRHDVQL